MTEFCVFFHDVRYHKYYVYYHHLDKYEVSIEIPNKCDSFEHSKLTKIKINQQLQNGLTMNDILKDYANNIMVWRNEILSSKKLKKPFDYMHEFIKDDGKKFSNTNESNIMRFFNSYSSRIYTNDTFDPIEWKEYKWYELENLASLQRCISGEYNCLGFDFKMAYPYYLSSQCVVNDIRKIFSFPTKVGKQYKLKKLKDDLKYGLYKVKIHTDNKDFQFVFNFNKENVYTHNEIIFCRKYQEQYNITIDLIIDDDYNALLYEKNDLIDGEKIFKMWLDRILELKKEFPTNGLVKLLSSSIWGYLSKTNKRFYNDIELDAKPEIQFHSEDRNGIDYIWLDERENHDGSMDYLLINKKQPYCKNYRLKPFILAFSRIIMAQICLDIGVDKIVRINTDNITFNKDLLSDEDIIKIKNISPTFVEEEKTTGRFYIKNVNNFQRL